MIDSAAMEFGMDLGLMLYEVAKMTVEINKLIYFSKKKNYNNSYIQADLIGAHKF
jgi:hypothetical protein